VIKRFTVLTVLPEPITALDALANNLRWSWHAPTRDLFEGIAPEIWERVHGDPVQLLGALEVDRLTELAERPSFVEQVQRAAGELDRYLSEPRWYQELGPDAPKSIAYFSPEFGITAVPPQYCWILR
jgi:starch phosphorylase